MALQKNIDVRFKSMNYVVLSLIFSHLFTGAFVFVCVCVYDAKLETKKVS